MTDKYKLILGSILLIGLIVLASALAFGKVEEKTSYGLTPLLAIIGKVTLDFSEWAFRGSKSDKEPKE
jgi:hypothetical protein